jgi:hypothetical protein
MKSLQRRDAGDDYRTYLQKLAAETGLQDPGDEALRRFDKQRKAKTMSNEESVSPADPDARIAPSI